MLKQLLIIFLFVTIISCKENPTAEIVLHKNKLSWTEKQKRKYFTDSIATKIYNGRYGMKNNKDSLNDFDVFSRIMFSDIKAKNIQDPFIYAFEEPYIDTTQIDSNVCWFRITINPCFRVPYCLIVEKKLNKTYLTAKMTNGHGGYHCGTLDITTTRIFSDTFYTNISNKLHQLDFWKLKNDSICKGGFDGENWTFEAIENGKYNLIDRWVPQACGDSRTLQLGKIGIDIRNKSKIFDMFSITYGLNNKQRKFLEE